MDEPVVFLSASGACQAGEVFDQRPERGGHGRVGGVDGVMDLVCFDGDRVRELVSCRVGGWTGIVYGKKIRFLHKGSQGGHLFLRQFVQIQGEADLAAHESAGAFKVDQHLSGVRWRA